MNQGKMGRARTKLLRRTGTWVLALALVAGTVALDRWLKGEAAISIAYLLGALLLLALLVARLIVVQGTLREQDRELRRQCQELERALHGQAVAKERLLAHASHELRTPLSAIHQFISLVTDGLAGPLKPTQQEYLDIALRNVAHLSRKIGDLLDNVRAEAGSLVFAPVPLPVGPFLWETIDALRSMVTDRGHTLDCEVTPGLPPVYADPARIRQLLTVLLDNAAKFTAGHGTITVRAYRAATAGFVEFSVTDLGCGIPPEKQATLFQRPSAAEAEANPASRRGLGLGLFIAREITRRHGGEIGVTSSPGQGSVFRFTLPVARP